MESTPAQEAEGKIIIRVLAAVLERLVCANTPLSKSDPGQVTKFHALKAPGIGILQYLERIHKYASCSTECFILALVYIDRLIQRNNFLLTKLNVHRVVITSILLAAKFFDDAYYNNAYYAKVGGVLVSEMNGLEVEFLFRINFSLHISPEVYKKYHDELISHAMGSNVPTNAVSNGLFRSATAPPILNEHHSAYNDSIPNTANTQYSSVIAVPGQFQSPEEEAIKARQEFISNHNLSMQITPSPPPSNPPPGPPSETLSHCRHPATEHNIVSVQQQPVQNDVLFRPHYDLPITPHTVVADSSHAVQGQTFPPPGNPYASCAYGNTKSHQPHYHPEKNPQHASLPTQYERNEIHNCYCVNPASESPHRENCSQTNMIDYSECVGIQYMINNGHPINMPNVHAPYHILKHSLPIPARGEPSSQAYMVTDCK